MKGAGITWGEELCPERYTSFTMGPENNWNTNDLTSRLNLKGWHVFEGGRSPIRYESEYGLE